MARRKAQTFGSALHCGNTAGASRRATCAQVGQRPIAHAICGRPVGTGRFSLPHKASRSAGSQQDLVVGPEGVPATARELDYASAGPQAPHLVPLHERLMMRPSSGERSIKDAGNPGITVFAEGGLGTWLGTRWGSLQEQDVYYYVRHQYKDQARATWGEDVLGYFRAEVEKSRALRADQPLPTLHCCLDAWSR